MKDVFRAMAVLLTLFSLTGCGLKGPLYFPPADKNAPPPIKTQTSTVQPSTPNSNDRGDDGSPSQVNY